MKNVIMILLAVMLFIGCSNDTLTPQEDEIYNCEWLLLNGSGWGSMMYETPSGIKVCRVSGILYYKTKNYIKTIGISGQKTFYRITTEDNIEFKGELVDDFY